MMAPRCKVGGDVPVSDLRGLKPGDEASVAYLRKCIASARRMDRLIQDVLAFAGLSREMIVAEPVISQTAPRGLGAAACAGWRVTNAATATALAAARSTNVCYSWFLPPNP